MMSGRLGRSVCVLSLGLTENLDLLARYRVDFLCLQLRCASSARSFL